MVQQIRSSKSSRVRIFQSQSKPTQPKTDFLPYVSELKRVLGLIEELEGQLLQTIRESKAKIMKYVRKYQDYGGSRLGSLLHLYCNPYLLINKINSQGSDDFVQELKRALRGEKGEAVDPFNPKYELITLQNKLKALLNAPTQHIFSGPASNNSDAHAPQL